jgi:acyl-[acyl-carrier-protein]-phospholipid O-acyltransferase/long-chain-fatty-acid--[acyl-carrier-protein] ligase
LVPHETIEAKIVEAFGLKTEEERVVAVVGVPDQAKGEALVLLATRDLSSDKMREHLLAGGLPNLWVPRTIKRVERIPILGSGKLDLGKCKELALM